MTFPVLVLGVLSLAGGYWLYRDDLLHRFLSPSSGTMFIPDAILNANAAQWISGSLFWMSTAAVVIGIIYGLVVYWKGLPQKEGWEQEHWSLFRRGAYKQFGYDGLLSFLGDRVGGAFSNVILYVVDRWIIDGLVNTSGYVTAGVGGMIRKIQTGYVRFYALVMLLGGVGVLGYFLYMLSIGGIK